MFQSLSEKRKGEAYLLVERILWSFFPIVGALSIAKLPALSVFAWSTFFSGCFFALVMLYRGSWREMYNRILWRYLVWVALFIGILYYGFYFVGLARTSPGNAALIALFEVCTSFVFFHLWRKDRISFEYIVGAGLMVLGAGVVLFPNVTVFNQGDFLVLLATFFPPIGNYFMQRAREIASSETIMFMRTFLATPPLFLIAYVFGDGGTFDAVAAALPLLLISGVILLGVTKFLWIEAIHRISVTKANALGSMAPLLTLALAWLILGHVPSVWQLLSSIPFILGILLLTDHLHFGTMRKQTL